MPTASVVGKLTTGSVHIYLHIDALAVNGSLCDDDVSFSLNVVLRVVIVAAQVETDGDGFCTVAEVHFILGEYCGQCHVRLRSNLCANGIGLCTVVPTGQRVAFLIECVVLRCSIFASGFHLKCFGRVARTFAGGKGNIIVRHLCGNVCRINSLNSEVRVIVGIAEMKCSRFVHAVVSRNHIVVIAAPLGAHSVQFCNLCTFSVGHRDVIAVVVSGISDLHCSFNRNTCSKVAPSVRSAMPLAFQCGCCILCIVCLADSSVFCNRDINIALCCQSLQLCQVSLDVAETYFLVIDNLS